MSTLTAFSTAEIADALHKRVEQRLRVNANLRADFLEALVDIKQLEIENAALLSRRLVTAPIVTAVAVAA